MDNISCSLCFWCPAQHHHWHWQSSTTVGLLPALLSQYWWIFCCVPPLSCCLCPIILWGTAPPGPQDFFANGYGPGLGKWCSVAFCWDGVPLKMYCLPHFLSLNLCRWWWTIRQHWPLLMSHHHFQQQGFGCSNRTTSILTGHLTFDLSVVDWSRLMHMIRV